MADVKIGDRVVIIKDVDLDNGIVKGDTGYINAAFEEENGNRYIMFQPDRPPLRFFWMAAHRVCRVEDMVNE